MTTKYIFVLSSFLSEKLILAWEAAISSYSGWLLCQGLSSGKVNKDRGNECQTDAAYKLTLQLKTAHCVTHEKNWVNVVFFFRLKKILHAFDPQGHAIAKIRNDTKMQMKVQKKHYCRKKGADEKLQRRGLKSAVSKSLHFLQFQRVSPLFLITGNLGVL